ncbi:glutamate--tRNA ligase [Candidatus Kaiserbacteria bacterium CG10_big_fil_rev_8_21_14_0_10_59_10]|uniref:Glutamate--tRNA ligase n=1 Tax=Candidatus Kaiserbacteria bacterium CG10_big_fil_rev_8_21_14_0_10_59_10 TaxID=1974612 RepID=A0A2H0U763_9BACT|nr:MAG: glutamate--tRNA ligase [Candidatus Kaiserbacteria bacterium CG10_big_fil_rev_8_21_14_0_10_59_10]
MKVVTRFPPSPTGHFHIGSARTALFNYLFALKHGGTMKFRLEDTDRTRSKPEYEQDITDGLKWLGLSYEPSSPLRQSERGHAYRTVLHALIEKGAAYEAETAVDDPEKRVVRFRNRGGSVSFTDLIRGEVSFDVSELSDFVIAKSMDEPLYHLAVVADDSDAGVTHVIRGEDHISNTPRQILILEALGYERPAYAHIPLILAPDRSKLSKRHGAVSISEYRHAGFLPEAMVNYLALLGWNPGGDREIFSLSELGNVFDLSHVNKSGAIFDIEKLRWFNRHYLLQLDAGDFARSAIERLRAAAESRSLQWDEKRGKKLLPLLRERVHVWSDIDDLVSAAEFDFFFTPPVLDAQNIPHKGMGKDNTCGHLSKMRALLEALHEDEFASSEAIKHTVWEYADHHGRGEVLWPLRYALTGKERSPDPFSVASILGKSETLSRIDSAIALLQ